MYSGQNAGGIAGVNASLLNVLHNAADDYIFSVRKCVDVYFYCSLEKMIDQNGAFLRILHRLAHVTNDAFVVICDYHSAPTKHVRRPHKYGILNPPGPFDRLFHTGGNRSWGLWNPEFVNQL